MNEIFKYIKDSTKMGWSITDTEINKNKSEILFCSGKRYTINIWMEDYI